MDAKQGASNSTITGRILLAVMAAVPFFLSLVFHTRGPAAQQPVEKADRPALVFDQYQVNLREVSPSMVVGARFGFTNRSDRRVTIQELKPSCGCLNPRLEKKVYEPGEEGEFFVRVQTANEKPGPKEYFVDVVYEDPQPRLETVAFKVVLPSDKVTVRPPGLLVYQGSSDPIDHSLVVTNYRDEPLEVTGIETGWELISAKVTESYRDAEGAERLEIEVTVAGDIPPGRHDKLLTIKTTDPVYPELVVPIMVQNPNSSPTLSEQPASTGERRQ